MATAPPYPDERVVEKFLAAGRAEGWALATVRARRSLLRRVARDLAPAQLTTVTRQQLTTWHSTLTGNPETIAALTSVVRGFYSWLTTTPRSRTDNPAASIGRPGRPRRPAVPGPVLPRIPPQRLTPAGPGARRPGEQRLHRARPASTVPVHAPAIPAPAPIFQVTPGPSAPPPELAPVLGQLSSNVTGERMLLDLDVPHRPDLRALSTDVLYARRLSARSAGHDLDSRPPVVAHGTRASHALLELAHAEALAERLLARRWGTALTALRHGADLNTVAGVLELPVAHVRSGLWAWVHERFDAEAATVDEMREVGRLICGEALA